MRMLFVIPLLATSPAAFQDTPEKWWIVATDGKEAFAVRQDDGAKEKIAAVKVPFKPLCTGYSACALSPDKTRIVYVETDGDTEIYAADPDGKNVRKLTDNGCDDGYPAWFPDGKRIVFASSRSGEFQVYAMSLDGSEVQQLSEKGERAHSPFVSPDGKVAYVAGDTDSRLVTREGNSSRVLLEDSWIREPVWSPDGRSIACVSLFSAHAIAIHDLRTGETRRVKTESIRKELSGWHAHSLNWRPDGKAVAFRMHWMNRSLPQSTFAQDKLFVAALDGKVAWLELPSAQILEWIRK